MSFTLTIPKAAHADLIEKLEQLEHVTLHEVAKPGRITHPSGGELQFTPIAGTDQVTVTVVSNPTNTPESEIKARLEADIKTLLS